MDDFEIDVLGLDDVGELDVDESALDISLDESITTKEEPTQEPTPMKTEASIATEKPTTPSESATKDSSTSVPPIDVKVQGKPPTERRMIKIPKSTTPSSTITPSTTTPAKPEATPTKPTPATTPKKEEPSKTPEKPSIQESPSGTKPPEKRIISLAGSKPKSDASKKRQQPATQPVPAPVTPPAAPVTGAAKPAKNIKDGATQRPDGTWRKPLRIRPGYTPPDEKEGAEKAATPVPAADTSASVTTPPMVAPAVASTTPDNTPTTTEKTSATTTEKAPTTTAEKASTTTAETTSTDTTPSGTPTTVPPVATTTEQETAATVPTPTKPTPSPATPSATTPPPVVEETPKIPPTTKQPSKKAKRETNNVDTMEVEEPVAQVENSTKKPNGTQSAAGATSALLNPNKIIESLQDQFQGNTEDLMRSIDDLKRKQGVALLQHIAKSYGIQIEIVDTTDVDRKRRLNTTETEERLKKVKSETTKNL